MAETDTAEAERPTGLPVQAADVPDMPAVGKPAASGSTLEGLIDPKKYETATASALEERKEYGRATGFIDQQMFDHTERDRSQMDRAYKAEGAAADAIPPKWNADEQREKYIRGPMESFGSVGSVFAMAASLFTKTPMTSALNAGAAAMKAVHDSDEKAYESAYKAWKDNTDLALKRFGMEHQMFQDSSHLMTTDMSAWAIKQKAVAARFENNNAMILLENGMYKEYIDTMQAQARGAEEIVKAKSAMEQFNLERSIIKASNEGAPKDETSQQYVKRNLELIHNINAAKHGYQQRIGAQGELHSYLLTRVPELIEAHKDDSNYTPGNAIRDATEEYTQASKKPAGAGGVSTSHENALDRQAVLKDVQAEHPEMTEGQQREEVNRRLKLASTVPSGNKQVELKQRINKFQHAADVSDKILDVLQKHRGAAGIAGKAMRLEERLGNILGNKSTEYVQMMRDVELLRGWAKELLFSKNERLKAEGQRINDIIAGTSAGDTGPNTVRAITDAKKLLLQMKGEDEAILSGKPAATPAETKPAPGGKAPWESAPIKVPAEKHSEIEADADAA